MKKMRDTNTWQWLRGKPRPALLLDSILCIGRYKLLLLDPGYHLAGRDDLCEPRLMRAFRTQGSQRCTTD